MPPQKAIIEAYKIKLNWLGRLLVRYRFWKHARDGFKFYLLEYGFSRYLIVAKLVEGEESRGKRRYIIAWSQTGAISPGDFHTIYGYETSEAIIEVTKEDIL